MYRGQVPPQGSSTRCTWCRLIYPAVFEAEAGGSQVQGLCELQSKVKARPDKLVRPSLKLKTLKSGGDVARRPVVCLATTYEALGAIPSTKKKSICHVIPPASGTTCPAKPNCREPAWVRGLAHRSFHPSQPKGPALALCEPLVLIRNSFVCKGKCEKMKREGRGLEQLESHFLFKTLSLNNDLNSYS